MDPEDYARKEIKKLMPRFAIAPSMCPEPRGTYTVFCWGDAKGNGMTYNHYTWKALPDGIEFYGIEHMETKAVFFVSAKRIRDTYDLFFSARQAASIAEDTAYWYDDNKEDGGHV